MARSAKIALANEYLQTFPDESARLLESLPNAEIVAFFRGRPGEQSAASFERLTPATAAHVLAELDAALACELLAPMDAADAAVLLARLDEAKRAEVLGAIPEPQRSELTSVLSYPPDSAGAIMDPHVIAFLRDTTADEALARLRRAGATDRASVFLVDSAGRLVGSATVLELALADGDARLDSFANPGPESVQAMAVREDVLDQFERTKAAVLPVTDFHGRLLGAIRHAALFDAAREEVSADIQAMVGASREETALSSVSFAVRKRLPWLEINLLTAFLAASVVGLFEETIARFTALAVLLPVVAGQSGNTGAQALAVAMRGLALREIRPRHWAQLATKETSVAAFNGVAVALTTSAGVFLWSRSLGLSLVIGTSMIISMTAAGLAGASIPVLLTAVGQDPAQSSSIILTTVTDVVGFFSFLGIATLLGSML
jgi:magnesium transporter